ncbi:hypothetical protein NQ318_015122 [Aromia moschata]|uniref:Uncharacterized protein n=1 Tax=Aromia moschata TaxID=1265417 RepID=A0AAV8YYF8_9CUCU|nr:hypothetical protein NQ318_015122 [Aromia moschata]
MFTLNYLNLSGILCVINGYLIKSALGHYCEFDACSEDQYCCGENKCCKKTIDVWAAILLIVIAIFVVVCLYIGRKKRHKYGPYNLLSEEKRTGFLVTFSTREKLVKSITRKCVLPKYKTVGINPKWNTTLAAPITKERRCLAPSDSPIVVKLDFQGCTVGNLPKNE